MQYKNWKFKIGNYIFLALLPLTLILLLVGFSDNKSIYQIITITIPVLLLLATLVVFVQKDNYELKTMGQYCVVFGMLMLFVNTSFVSIKRLSITTKQTDLIMYFIIINFAFILWFYMTIMKIKKDYIKKCLSNIYDILVLDFIFVLFNINIFSLWFKSDSNTYYTNIVEMVRSWDFSLTNINKLSIGGHSSYGYSLFMYIGQSFIPHEGMGVRIVNVLMALITINMVYSLIKSIFIGINKIEAVIITSMFAFSPLVLGIMQEINTDFSVMCFFVWFIYFYVNEYTILKFFAGCLLCFSKETGILFLFFFMLGCWVYRIKVNIKGINICKFFTIFGWKEWILAIPPIGFCIITYLNPSGWGNKVVNVNNNIEKMDNMENTIDFNWYYIWVKVKELMMNFSWLIILLFLAFVIYVFIKKVRIKFDNPEIMLGIFMTFLSFISFNFIYFTWPNYRYIQMFAFFEVIMTAIIVKNFNVSEKIRRSILSIIVILFITESYITIDPMTYILFKNVNVGRGKIVTTSSYEIKEYSGARMWNQYEGGDLSKHVFRDFVQYNRDYVGFETVFEKMMKEIHYNDKKIVVYPGIYSQYPGDEYTLENLLGRKTSSGIYWNGKDITRDKLDLKVNLLDAEYLTDDVFGNSDEVWFIRFPYETSWNYDEFLKSYYINDEMEISVGKWSLDLYKLAKKAK